MKKILSIFTGIAACVYLNLNADKYDKSDDGLKVESFGGADMTGVNSFMAGLKA